MNILIEPMRPEEIAAVSEVLGKAYVTSPMVIAAFGANHFRYEKMMKIMLERFPGQILVAKDAEQIVGAMRKEEWPNCMVSPLKMLPLLPTVLIEFRVSTLQLLKWFPVWAKHDPKKPHWHFGPFGVLPDRQRQGIGSQLLSNFCEDVDRLGAASFLETDKLETVRLYERFGFVVTEEAAVLGMPNWFMWRSPQSKV